MKRFVVNGYGGKPAVTVKVDDCDAYLLRGHVWYVAGKSRRVTRYSGLGCVKTLAQTIVDAPSESKVRHLNGDTTDCTRANLEFKRPEAAC